jgi:glycosyltransferase involved in cell wall biosynthesis
MKVALIGKYGEDEIVAGPERVARELFNELRNKNVDVIFIEYFFSDYKDSSILKKLFGKKYINSKIIFRLGIIPLILKIFKNNYDVIHIVNSQRFILFILSLRYFFHGKIVTTFHGFFSNEIPKGQYLQNRYFLDYWLEKSLIKNSDELIFPSTLLWNKFNNHYKIQRQHRIIPNGISSIFFNEGCSFPEIHDELKIVFYNGYKTSIDRGLRNLLILLQNLKIKITIFILGDKQELDILNSKILIQFLPALSQLELINLLTDKHFIIKSSSFDTFSIFIAECMTLGIIPIVHSNTGINEFIENRINGFIYSENQNEELTKLLEEITQGIYDLKSISMNAKKIYYKLNWPDISEHYLDVYKSTI